MTHVTKPTATTDVQRLESLAQQLAARVRDDDPEANLRWLRAQLGVDPAAPVSDIERLLFLVAGAIPDNRPWWDLTEWARTPDEIELRKAMRRQALLNATAHANGAGRRRAA